MRTRRMTHPTLLQLAIAALSFALTCAAGLAAPARAVASATTPGAGEASPAAPARSRAEILAAERAALAASASPVVVDQVASVRTLAVPPRRARAAGATRDNAAMSGRISAKDKNTQDTSITPATPPPTILDRLLRGEDTRAAIAQARATEPHPAVTTPEAATDAFSAYARAHDALRGQLQAAPREGPAKASASRDALWSAVTTLQAQALLAQARLEADNTILQGLRLPASARALASTQQQRVRDHLARVMAAAATLASTLKAQSAPGIGAAVTAELQALLALDTAD
ncbi:MAG: hypothetical protein JNN30_15895, partial [Rhodanobacteraceae bacterium]|nr:hypothetical protein [Rhodanobacteraceae bacterium]